MLNDDMKKWQTAGSLGSLLGLHPRRIVTIARRHRRENYTTRRDDPHGIRIETKYPTMNNESSRQKTLYRAVEIIKDQPKREGYWTAEWPNYVAVHYGDNVSESIATFWAIPTSNMDLMSDGRMIVARARARVFCDAMNALEEAKKAK